MRKKSKKVRPLGPAAKPLTTAELKKLAAGFQAAYDQVRFLQKRFRAHDAEQFRDGTTWER